LRATSNDLPLAESNLPEAAVSLARFKESWVAAYREGTVEGLEYVVVRSGEAIRRIGPFLGGPIDDRPAIVELDAQHLLVVFSYGVDPSGSGVANVARLAYSVVDVEDEAVPTWQPLHPLHASATGAALASQSSPSLERSPTGDAFFMAWRGEAYGDDASGDQLWLRRLRWAPNGAETAPSLTVGDTELLLPRICEGSLGDQRTPALAWTALPPHGALVAAWDDFGTTPSNTGEPGVVVHYAPHHPGGSEAFVAERWSGPTGTPWPSRWPLTHDPNLVGPANLDGEAQFKSLASGSSVSDFVYSDAQALNIDARVRVRFTASNLAAGLVAKKADDHPDSYLLARVSTIPGDTFRIEAIVDGEPSDVLTSPPPLDFLQEGYSSDYVLRFRVVSSGGELFVGMKFWPEAQPEPANWLQSATLGTSSTVTQRFGQVVGRFGAWLHFNQGP
jgi:hypothetical protein